MMFETPRRALGWLIVISTGLRLVWGAVLGVGNDEAYHSLFVVHPDWSYFDHPPMTMWVEQVGVFLAGGITPLTLRLGFILMFAGSTWVLFKWTARWHGEWAGFYAAFALNITAYYTAAAGAFALPDGPLLFFSLLTLWALSDALITRPGQVLPWVWVGLAWGGAMLSKYHAAFLPAAAFLYVLVTPATRRCLRTPGPYLAIILGIAAFSPVLIWNVQNDWVSFTFQANRAVGWQFKPESLARTIGGQALYLFPWIWVALLLVLVAQVKIGRQSAGIERLMSIQSAVPLAFFLAISCVRTNLPHWSLVGFVPMFPALGAKWAQQMQTSPTQMRRKLVFGVTITIVGAILAAGQTRLGIIPLKKDPTWDMSGWPSVTRELESRGLVGKPNTFFFTSRWFTSGHLAFEIGNRSPVLCYNPGDAHSFADWSQPEDWVGKDGILVSLDDRIHEAEMYAPFFRRVELIAEFPMTRNGIPFRTVRVYRCFEQLLPFPFKRVRPGS